MCRNINFICHKYDIDKWNLSNVSMNSIDLFEERDVKVNAIREFVQFRDTLSWNTDDYANVTDIITSLCED